MSRVTPIKNNFTGGELSPFMLGRFDHEVWDVSVLEMVGFVPRPQGPAEACPGFEDMGALAGPARLITLEPFVDQGYVIEASAGKFRFWTNDVLLESPPGTPIEVAHPYSYAELLEMDYEASNDVLYLYHGNHQTRQLTRTGAESFELTLFEVLQGPFDDRNVDRAATVAASGTGLGETVTLTASTAIFAAGDVGGLFEIEYVDMAAIKVWEPGVKTTTGQLIQWDGNVYQAGVAGTTGSFAPIHLEGVVFDGSGGVDINNAGPYGVSWTYLYNGYGQLKITVFITAMAVQATVLRPLAGTYASWRWRFGAFSSKRGWPEHGRIHQERHVLTKGDVRYFSQVGLLDDFNRFNEFGDIGDDQAIIAGLNQPNRIQWLFSGTSLFTGSASHESTIDPASAARGIAPGNIRNVIHGDRGSAAVRPIEHDGRPIFVQRNGRKLMMLREGDYDRYEPEDLTRYADQIGKSGIRELAKQMEPLQLIWGCRDDGLLFGASLVPEEQVLGFFRRPLADGMLCRSLTRVTSPNGNRDDLWIAAERGDGSWRMMKLAPFREACDSDPTAIMLDAARRETGAPASTISLPHLVGKTVQVVADGAWLGDFVVPVGGLVDFDRAASDRMAGLPFEAYIRDVPFEGGGDAGPAQFKMKRTSRVFVRLQNSLGVRITVDGAPESAIDVENQRGNSVMDAALPFMTEDRVLEPIGASNRIGEIRIDRTAPKQTSLLAIGRITETAQK